MQVSLCKLILFRMAMGRENNPQQHVEMNFFLNRLDEAFNFMCTHISQDILFHIEGLRNIGKILNLIPRFLQSPQSLKVEKKIPRDMSAHEAEGLIKPIQKFVLLNMILGLSFSSHFHPKKTNISQGYLHIFPPINIVEGFKETEYER